MSVFHKIDQFNREVVGINQTYIRKLEPETKKWLANCIIEEAHELAKADTIVDQVDALIDALYFAGGGLTRMGFPPEVSEVLFDIIHYANMAKAKGVKPTRITPLETDAIKPAGWTAPEGSLASIINNYRKEDLARRPLLNRNVECETKTEWRESK